MNKKITSSDIKNELKAIVLPPYTWEAGFLCNLFIAVGILILAVAFPSIERDNAFKNDVMNGFNLRRPGVIGLFLTSWLLSDVTVFNQLAYKMNSTLNHLENGLTLSQTLYLSNVIVMIATMALSAVAVFIADPVSGHQKFVLIDLLLAFCPMLTYIGFGNIASIFLPFKPLKLSELGKRVSEIPMWLLKIALPYVMASVLLVISIWPLYLEKNALGNHSQKVVVIFIFGVCWSFLVGLTSIELSYYFADIAWVRNVGIAKMIRSNSV